jgi:hypothetical protein
VEQGEDRFFFGLLVIDGTRGEHERIAENGASGGTERSFKVSERSL